MERRVKGGSPESIPATRWRIQNSRHFKRGAHSQKIIKHQERAMRDTIDIFNPVYLPVNGVQSCMGWIVIRAFSIRYITGG